MGSPIRMLLAATVAAAALLAQGLFPNSPAAPVDAPPTAMCDRAAGSSTPDDHVITSTASLQHDLVCTVD